MGIFKEQVRELEELQRRQVHVFLDEEGQAESADMGLWDTPELRARIKELIDELPDGGVITMKLGDKPIGRKFRTAVVWEMERLSCSYTKIEINWYENWYRGKRKPYFEIITTWTHGSPEGYRNHMRRCGQKGF